MSQFGPSFKTYQKLWRETISIGSVTAMDWNLTYIKENGKDNIMKMVQVKLLLIILNIGKRGSYKLNSVDRNAGHQFNVCTIFANIARGGSHWLIGGHQVNVCTIFANIGRMVGIWFLHLCGTVKQKTTWLLCHTSTIHL